MDIYNPTLGLWDDVTPLDVATSFAQQQLVAFADGTAMYVMGSYIGRSPRVWNPVPGPNGTWTATRAKNFDPAAATCLRMGTGVMVFNSNGTVEKNY